jgi:N-sulfoglucosamine sulfohydrolase
MFELFELANDPHEFNNLSGGNELHTFERERKAVLQEWLSLERGYIPLPISPVQ